MNKRPKESLETTTKTPRDMLTELMEIIPERSLDGRM